MNNIVDTASWGVGGVGAAAERVVQGAGQGMETGAAALRSTAERAATAVTSAGSPMRPAAGVLNNLTLPLTPAPKPKSKTQCLCDHPVSVYRVHMVVVSG